MKTSILVACAFWGLDAAADAYVFARDDAWAARLWPEDAKTLWMRAFVVLVLLAFGLYANRVVGARKQDARKLALGRKIFERSSEGILVTDASNRIIDVNAAFEAISGYRREEVLGQSPSMFSSGRHDSDFYRRMWDSIARTGHWDGEIWDRRKDGDIHPKWISIDTVFDDHGRVANYFAVIKDITEFKARQQELISLAYRDPLTHLPNRRLLDDRLRHALRMAERRRSGIAVLFIDLDGFKQVNDTHGHLVGDELLLAVTERIGQVIRNGDTLARLSGDEFVLMLSDVRRPGAEAAVAEKLCEALHQPFSLEGESIRVSASIGIARYPEDADCASELLRRADAAMYAVKASGRGHYRYYKALEHAQPTGAE